MIAKHGGDVYGNRGVVLDFSVNINPLGTPDFIKKAMASSLDDVSRYPDTRCRKLRSAAAAWYRVSEDTLIFGNGAAELLFLAVHALRPKRAIITAPSFLEYETALAAFDVPADFFPLKKEEGFHLPADRFVSFLEEKKPEMIFLCNPANPTGVLTERAEMEKILDFCETRGIFAVVDECFLEFLMEPERYSVLGCVRAGKKWLLVLQAITKTFAVPGIRLGYGFLSDAAVRERMEAARQPWSVSVTAQAAGAAAFGPEREAFLKKTREFLLKERPYFAEELKKRGFFVYDGAADYLFFEDIPGRGDGKLYEECLAGGILIRSCANYRGLDGQFYRVSVGSREKNGRFLEMIDSLY